MDDIEASKTTPVDKRYISTTDPDASVTRHRGSKSKVRYKTHRAVDEKHEIITATKVTAGSVDDGHALEDMIDAHERNTEHTVETAVADSKYGTIDNFLLCRDRKIKAHMPSLEKTGRGSGRQKGIFPKEEFIYDPVKDAFLCPAGRMLQRRNYNKKRTYYEYKASSAICSACPLRKQCTRAKDGRSLKRHARHDDLEAELREAGSKKARKDVKRRQDLSERSFAWSTRYGYKRARWRNLWRMEIQDFLIAAVQNIAILMRQSTGKMSKSNVRTGEMHWGDAKYLQIVVIVNIFKNLFGIGHVLPSPA